MCILQCGYQHPVSDSAREAGPRGVHQRRAFSSFRRSLAAWSDWPSEFQARMPATLVASGCCEALTHFACFVDDSLSALPATRPDCNRGTKVCFVWTMPIVRPIPVDAVHHLCLTMRRPACFVIQKSNWARVDDRSSLRSLSGSAICCQP
jgi:hypothetical protein